MDVSIQVQIIALWTGFLFGLVFHSQLAMMPLLYGQSVAMPESSGKMPIIHSWLMLGFYAIPMIAIAATATTDSPIYRIIHFGLTIAYTVMNFTHAAMDLGVKPIEWYQILLMVIVFLNGILLNVIAFQWMQ